MKNIVILDTSFLVSLARNAKNIPIDVALEHLSSQYDLRITETVMEELENSQYANNSTLQAWIESKGGYSRIETPITLGLIKDGALKSDPGEFSILETAKQLDHPKILIDDGFFNEIDSGKSQLRDGFDQSHPSFKAIKE